MMCNSTPTGQNDNNRLGLEQERENISNWLAVTASRKAKWWYSAFHNVTAMVGAGVLGLPFAMSQLGWAPGAIAILGSWVMTFYSLRQMVELHEFIPGKRFDRYTELGQHAFGEKLGYWVVMPQQMMVQVASDIVYMVTGGKSLKKCFDLLSDNKWVNIRQTYFIIFFGGIQLFLSQTPNFNSLKVVSLIAAVMSIGYSMVAFVASMRKGYDHSHLVRHGLRSHTTAGIVFDIFNSLGTIAFAFAGHSVVLEIQATIPSTQDKPSKKPMWLGCIVAYAVVAVCYVSVAFSGFWAFGDLVEDDVLVSLERPVWIIAIANFMVFLHVLGSYQVFAMTVFDILESVSVQKLHLTPGLPLRIIVRSTYVDSNVLTEKPVQGERGSKQGPTPRKEKHEQTEKQGETPLEVYKTPQEVGLYTTRKTYWDKIQYNRAYHRHHVPNVVTNSRAWMCNVIMNPSIALSPKVINNSTQGSPPKSGPHAIIPEFQTSPIDPIILTHCFGKPNEELAKVMPNLLGVEASSKKMYTNFLIM